MKVLFLDVDGVLNSNRTVVASGTFSHPGNYKSRPECLDWTAIRMLQSLCTTLEIKVVLSSSWRIGMKEDELKAFADFLGLPIIDKTKVLDRSRGWEIAEWLNRHEVENYAILDDDTDMLVEQMPHFVRTSIDNGISWTVFNKLCSLFEVNPFNCIGGARVHTSEE
jgi:hypothetical protein